MSAIRTSGPNPDTETMRRDADRRQAQMNAEDGARDKRIAFLNRLQALTQRAGGSGEIDAAFAFELGAWFSQRLGQEMGPANVALAGIVLAEEQGL